MSTKKAISTSFVAIFIVNNHTDYCTIHCKYVCYNKNSNGHL